MLALMFAVWVLGVAAVTSLARYAATSWSPRRVVR